MVMETSENCTPHKAGAPTRNKTSGLDCASFFLTENGGWFRTSQHFASILNSMFRVSVGCGFPLVWGGRVVFFKFSHGTPPVSPRKTHDPGTASRPLDCLVGTLS